jgi:DNA ligase (NAD+)
VRQGESFGFNVTKSARLVEGVLSRLRDTKVLDTKKHYLVRGEAIIHRSIFKEKYLDVAERGQREYESPRNMVAGLFNSNDAVGDKEHLRRCTFIALHLFRKENGVWRRPFDAHKEWVYLTLMGFTTALNPVRYSEGHWKLREMVKQGHESLRRVLPVFEMGGSVGANAYWDHIPSEEEVKERLNTIHAAVDIQCDGLVVQPLNNKVFQAKKEQLATHPAFMRAIKLEPQDQKKFEGVVDHIEWKVKKRGLVRPRLILKKGIQVEGAMINHATCNNAAFVTKWALQPGRRLQLIRSGDIIPRIVSVLHRGNWLPLQVKKGAKWVDGPGIWATRTVAMSKQLEMPTECPACNSKLRWNTNGVNLYCTNAKCPGEHGERILSFFRLLGVDDVAGATVKTLIAAGLNTVPKIVHGATVQRLMKLDRYGEKKAQIVAKAIAGALKGIPLAKVMHASTCFGDESMSLGSSRLQAIVDTVGEGAVARMPQLELRTKLAGVHGIGPRTVDIFIDGLPEWRKFFEEVKAVYEPPSGPKTLKEVVACWTGFRNEEAERYLVGHGGRVSGNVTRTTTVLFAASSSSGKAKKADDLQIEVVAQGDMWNWLKKRGG